MQCERNSVVLIAGTARFVHLLSHGVAARAAQLWRLIASTSRGSPLQSLWTVPTSAAAAT